MKKLFMMMALVATALFTTTACGDDDDDNGGGNEVNETVTFTPPYKNEAKVLNITQDNAEGIKRLHIMESGAYMIARETGANGVRATRSVDLTDFEYEFGTYTVANGIFTFSNGMKIAFESTGGKNYDITITWKNGTTIKTTGTLDTSSAVKTGVMTDNLCSRPWKILTLRAVGNYNGMKPVKEFTGPINLYDIKKWYEDNFGKLKDEFDAGTVIEGIYFDEQGLFSINYKNRNADVGVWRWTDMNSGKLAYSWNNAATAISLFTGDASVAFTKNPDNCKLTLKGNVNNVDLEFVFKLQ